MISSCSARVLGLTVALLVSGCGGGPFIPGHAEVGACFVDPGPIREIRGNLHLSDDTKRIDCTEPHLGQVIGQGDRECPEVFERFDATSPQAELVIFQGTNGLKCTIIADGPTLVGQYVDPGPEDPD